MLLRPPSRLRDLVQNPIGQGTQLSSIAEGREVACGLGKEEISLAALPLGDQAVRQSLGVLVEAQFQLHALGSGPFLQEGLDQGGAAPRINRENRSFDVRFGRLFCSLWRHLFLGLTGTGEPCSQADKEAVTGHGLSPHLALVHLNRKIKEHQRWARFWPGFWWSLSPLCKRHTSGGLVSGAGLCHR